MVQQHKNKVPGKKTSTVKKVGEMKTLEKQYSKISGEIETPELNKCNQQ